jgi:magnesium transporter
MIEAILWTPSAEAYRSGGAELISEWQKSDDSLIWVNLDESLSRQAIEPVAEVFGLHPLAVQDALRERHPPKLEAFDDTTFILLKGLSANVAELEYSTIQLAIFIGPRFLLTRHSAPSVSVTTLKQELAVSPVALQGGAEGLALRLCKILSGRYLKLLLGLEPRLEELEDEILVDTEDDILAELINKKTELKKLRRVFLYHQQIFRQLQDHADFTVFRQRSHELNDVYEQQERASSLAGLYYELASDLVDGYLSVSAHRLNEIMKVLTIVAAIFIPLTFLAGIYGMNFDNMPELHSTIGYFVVLVVMTIIAIALLVLFRKKRWL